MNNMCLTELASVQNRLNKLIADKMEDVYCNKLPSAAEKGGHADLGSFLKKSEFKYLDPFLDEIADKCENDVRAALLKGGFIESDIEPAWARISQKISTPKYIEVKLDDIPVRKSYAPERTGYNTKQTVYSAKETSNTSVILFGVGGLCGGLAVGGIIGLLLSLPPGLTVVLSIAGAGAGIGVGVKIANSNTRKTQKPIETYAKPISTGAAAATSAKTPTGAPTSNNQRAALEKQRDINRKELQKYVESVINAAHSTIGEME